MIENILQNEKNEFLELKNTILKIQPESNSDNT